MNMAARRGNLPKPLKNHIELMAENGWSVRATSHSDRVRRELGLRPLKRPNTGEIRSIS